MDIVTLHASYYATGSYQVLDGELIGDPSSQLNWSLGARLPKRRCGVDAWVRLYRNKKLTRETRTCICCGPCVAIKRDNKKFTTEYKIRTRTAP